MKQLLITILLIPVFAFSQDGVYMTLEDFKAHKLSKQCEHINRVNTKLVLITGDQKEVVMMNESGIWGYKVGDTDYRVIDGRGRAIATRGEIWFYGDDCDGFKIEEGTNDTTYRKNSRSYPYASKGIDGPLIKLTSDKILFGMMDPVVGAEVKAKVKKFLVGLLMEDIADYYNSIRPGYLSNRFKKFFWYDNNVTANGKRPISF